MILRLYWATWNYQFFIMAIQEKQRSNRLAYHTCKKNIDVSSEGFDLTIALLDQWE